MAFNAGNLGPVVEVIKAKYPDKQLIIAADNDLGGERNVGIETARDVATQFSVPWTYPELGTQKCDFNDVHQAEGLTAVKRQIESNLQDPGKEENTPTEMTVTVDEDTEILRLAKLSVLEYEKTRKSAAGALEARPSILDKLVAAKRKELESDPGGTHSELFEGISPWEEPVNGEQIIDEVVQLFRRHTIMPEGGYESAALWVVGTYVFNCFRIFPRLCISSPEKRCGKTRVLESLAAVSSRALMASNMSSAVIFRSIDAWQPSLLVDEGDTFLHGNEELRGVVNSGHTRSGANILRVEEVGGTREPKEFSTWAPMAIAMIKTPPDTILDRSVLIQLRRKLPNELVTRMPIELKNDCLVLRRKLQRWADDHTDRLLVTFPDVPRVGNDRAEDNWELLLTIADAIGGDWPTRARETMQQLEAVKNTDDGVGPMILTDIRQVFEEKGIERLQTQTLVDHLVDLEDRPWSEWKHGKPMTKTSLSRLISPYGIKSKNIRDGYGVKKGYERSDFEDAFARYLPSTPFQNATPLHSSNDAACSVAFSNSETPLKNQNATPKPSNGAGCSGVAFSNREEGENAVESEELEL